MSRSVIRLRKFCFYQQNVKQQQNTWCVGLYHACVWATAVEDHLSVLQVSEKWDSGWPWSPTFVACEYSIRLISCEWFFLNIYFYLNRNLLVKREKQNKQNNNTWTEHKKQQQLNKHIQPSTGPKEWNRLWQMLQTFNSINSKLTQCFSWLFRICSKVLLCVWLE